MRKLLVQNEILVFPVGGTESLALYRQAELRARHPAACCRPVASTPRRTSRHPAKSVAKIAVDRG